MEWHSWQRLWNRLPIHLSLSCLCGMMWSTWWAGAIFPRLWHRAQIGCFDSWICLNCFHCFVLYSLLNDRLVSVSEPPWSLQNVDPFTFGLLQPNSRHVVCFGVLGITSGISACRVLTAWAQRSHRHCFVWLSHHPSSFYRPLHTQACTLIQLLLFALVVDTQQGS